MIKETASELPFFQDGLDISEGQMLYIRAQGLLPARLAALMKERRINQADLADATDYSVATIQAYVSNRRMPTFEALFKLCTFFDVTPDYLLGFSDVHRPEYAKNVQNLHISPLAQSKLKELIKAEEHDALELVSEMIYDIAENLDNVDYYMHRIDPRHADRSRRLTMSMLCRRVANRILERRSLEDGSYKDTEL